MLTPPKLDDCNTVFTWFPLVVKGQTPLLRQRIKDTTLVGSWGEQGWGRTQNSEKNAKIIPLRLQFGTFSRKHIYLALATELLRFTFTCRRICRSKTCLQVQASGLTWHWSTAPKTWQGVCVEDKLPAPAADFRGATLGKQRETQPLGAAQLSAAQTVAHSLHELAFNL